MKFAELIYNYRTEHGLSQRQFAARCGVSNGYISMIEKNMNPKTGLPLVPSMQQCAKIAQVMGISLQELFSLVDDMPIDLSSESKNPPSIFEGGHTAEFITLFMQLTESEQKMIVNQIKGILSAR